MFSIKVQNQPPNFLKSPGWNLAIKSLKSSRKFNNTITLKSNKGYWSFIFLRNQTIYAITPSTAIVSYKAINKHNVVHQNTDYHKKGHKEDTGHEVRLHGTCYSKLTQKSSFILKITFLSQQLITYNCEQLLIQVRISSLGKISHRLNKGHTEYPGTFMRQSQHTGKNLLPSVSSCLLQ